MLIATLQGCNHKYPPSIQSTERSSEHRHLLYVHFRRGSSMRFRLTNESDSNVGAAYWTAAECNVAIICACLPFLRPIVSRLFPRFLSTNSYNRYTRNPTMSASRMTATRMTARSHRQKVELYSQDRDYGMYTIDVKSGEASHDGALDGIAVTTTTMIQETSRNNDESTSQRRLVVDV